MKDPVCGMEVLEKNAIRGECDGEEFYFCSVGCRNKFLMERECALPRTSYDAIIVGGGPAGLTAAVYASTLKMEALLIAGNLGGQAIDSTKIHNYMGFDFITGPELVEKFRLQLIHSHYIDHIMNEVEKIERKDDGFIVTTSELMEYQTKSLILATGMTRRRLGVPGEERFQRRGIFYGSIQDLSFVQGGDVAVIGGGNSALQATQNLGTVAGTIHLVSDSALKADPVEIEKADRIPNLKRHEGYKVVEIRGDEVVSSIRIRKMAADEAIDLPVKGVFVAIGLKPNSQLISHLADVNQKGEVIVNPDCSTSCPGVFAAGDVTNSFGKRIIIASGEGAKAAMAAKQYVLDLRKTAFSRSNASGGI